MMRVDIQEVLFEQLRVQLPASLTLVYEISDLLNISLDSAYRRLRNETPLTFQEVAKIADYFKISLDGIINVETDSIQFSYNRKRSEAFDYTDYLRQVSKELELIDREEKKEAFFFAKDFPLFYNFLIPEIAEFKGYFWLKSALQCPEYRNRKFNVDHLDETNVSLGFDIVKTYNRIPSKELWNSEVFNSLLNQIAYCSEAGFFASTSHALKMLEYAEQLLDHFALQAEHGKKFLYGKEPGSEENLQLYFNEVMIGDNTFLLKRGKDIFLVVTHNIVHNLMTTDKAFCEKTWEIHTNLTSRSTLISSYSEKERNKFFNHLRKRIGQMRYRLQG